MAELKNTATWRDSKNNILRGVLRDPNYYTDVIDKVENEFGKHNFNIYAEITAPNKKTGECDIVVLNIEAEGGRLTQLNEENLSKLLELLATPGAELTKLDFSMNLNGSIDWYSAELGKELNGDIILSSGSSYSSDWPITMNDLLISFNAGNDLNYAGITLREEITATPELTEMGMYTDGCYYTDKRSRWDFNVSVDGTSLPLKTHLVKSDPNGGLEYNGGFLFYNSALPRLQGLQRLGRKPFASTIRDILKKQTSNFQQNFTLPPETFKVTGAKGAYGFIREDGTFHQGDEFVNGKPVGKAKWFSLSQSPNGEYTYWYSDEFHHFYKKGKWTLAVDEVKTSCKNYVKFYPLELSSENVYINGVASDSIFKSGYASPHMFAGPQPDDDPGGRILSNISRYKLMYSNPDSYVDRNKPGVNAISCFPGKRPKKKDKKTLKGWAENNANHLFDKQGDKPSLADAVSARANELGKSVFISKSVFPQSMQDSWPTV
jgi:hypothetical protein